MSTQRSLLNTWLITDSLKKFYPNKKKPKPLPAYDSLYLYYPVSSEEERLRKSFYTPT
jgi:hypothetical protein